ncbi:MAG: molybdopterin-dependent oxidoreductase [Halolamina sp.]
MPPRIAGRDVGTVVRRLGRRLSPPPQVVDWSLGVGVAVEVVSGLASFTVGTPGGAWLFWLHSVVGLSLVVLLGAKLWRVRRRLATRATWDRATPLSILQAVVTLAALGTGTAWVAGYNVQVGFWTTLNVHVGLGLALVALVAVHLAARFHSPADIDPGRRAALGTGAALVWGALTWRASEAVAGARDATSRFTGSRPTGELYDTDTEGGAFPVTSWVADDPDPVDREAWTLTVTGAVDDDLTLDLAAVDPVSGGSDASEGARDDDGEAATLTATLDCTSGWYTVQEWRGRQVGDLLAAAGVADDARYVRFVSVTGYRWSLPLAEARDALLATSVGDDRLSHGHGGPARLVAPGRRGFQWVKWVERVEVRRHGDPAQWLVTLLSGFD